MWPRDENNHSSYNFQYLLLRVINDAFTIESCFEVLWWIPIQAFVVIHHYLHCVAIYRYRLQKKCYTHYYLYSHYPLSSWFLFLKCQTKDFRFILLVSSPWPLLALIEISFVRFRYFFSLWGRNFRECGSIGSG